VITGRIICDHMLQILFILCVLREGSNLCVKCFANAWYARYFFPATRIVSCECSRVYNFVLYERED